VYHIVVIVQDRSPKFGGLCGKRLEDSGIQRLDGVRDVHRYSAESLPEIQAGQDVPSNRAGQDMVHGDSLRPRDKLMITCDENGIVSLRQHPGLEFGNQADLDKLGAYRRQRNLYEVSVAANSELLYGNIDVMQEAEFFRNTLGACLVAVKSPPSHVDTKFALQAGSVLLLEADHRFMRQRAIKWGSMFSVIRCVPNSSPPRGTLSIDVCRNAVTCAGMVILISLVTADVVELHIGGMAFLLLLLFTRALTVSQLLESMKPKILLTIVGALALGTALEKSGVVNYVAGLLTVAHGPIAITSFIYIISVVLSMFINNSATIAILAPMLIQLADSGDAGMRIEPMVWALVYGAGSCFTTPLGYQTNLMVMPDGQYSFSDFARFGAVIQLCHLCLTVFFTYSLTPTALELAGVTG
jgi:hypothetical protein